MKKQITSLIRELDIDLSMSATEKVAKIRSYGQDLGFSLSEVIDEIHHSLDETHHSRVKVPALLPGHHTRRERHARQR